MTTSSDVRLNALVSSYLFGLAVIGWANHRAAQLDSLLTQDELLANLGDTPGLDDAARSAVEQYLMTSRELVESAIARSEEGYYAPPADVSLLDTATRVITGAAEEVEESLQRGIGAITELLSHSGALDIYPYVFKANVLTQPVGEHVRGGLLAMAMGTLEKGLSELADIEAERPGTVPIAVSNISELLPSAQQRLSAAFGDDDSLFKDMSDINELRNSIVHREGRMDARLLNRYQSAIPEGREGAFISLSETELNEMIETMTGFGLRVIFAAWKLKNSDSPYILAVLTSTRKILERTNVLIARGFLDGLTEKLQTP